MTNGYKSVAGLGKSAAGPLPRWPAAFLQIIPKADVSMPEMARQVAFFLTFFNAYAILSVPAISSSPILA